MWCVCSKRAIFYSQPAPAQHYNTDNYNYRTSLKRYSGKPKTLGTHKRSKEASKNGGSSLTKDELKLVADRFCALLKATITYFIPSLSPHTHFKRAFSRFAQLMFTFFYGTLNPLIILCTMLFWVHQSQNAIISGTNGKKISIKFNNFGW